MGPGAEADRPYEARLIKRYANRKLYDTVARKFTSLGAIRSLVRDGYDVVVVDHATGADLTAETLGQTLSQRRGRSGSSGLGLGVLSELIRAPERLDRALSGDRRDADELRSLRDEVRALSKMIDSLLDDPPADDLEPER
jgi:polyhydroxyalkanoate synthesis repressor PhaR